MMQTQKRPFWITTQDEAPEEIVSTCAAQAERAQSVRRAYVERKQGVC